MRMTAGIARVENDGIDTIQRIFTFSVQAHSCRVASNKADVVHLAVFKPADREGGNRVVETAVIDDRVARSQAMVAKLNAVAAHGGCGIKAASGITTDARHDNILHAIEREGRAYGCLHETRVSGVVCSTAR